MGRPGLPAPGACLGRFFRTFFSSLSLFLIPRIAPHSLRVFLPQLMSDERGEAVAQDAEARGLAGSPALPAPGASPGGGPAIAGTGAGVGAGAGMGAASGPPTGLDGGGSVETVRLDAMLATQPPTDVNMFIRLEMEKEKRLEREQREMLLSLSECAGCV